MCILNIKNTFKFKRAKCLTLFSSSYWVKRLGSTLAWAPTMRDWCVAETWTEWELELFFWNVNIYFHTKYIDFKKM